MPTPRPPATRAVDALRAATVRRISADTAWLDMARGAARMVDAYELETGARIAEDAVHGIDLAGILVGLRGLLGGPTRGIISSDADSCLDSVAVSAGWSSIDEAQNQLITACSVDNIALLEARVGRAPRVGLPAIEPKR